ncbi:flagellin lysine-N-methylase [Bacillus sp. ISL-8]|nr:flagellin lysine-N-methylase [Bacillus sp. ISL-8]
MKQKVWVANYLTTFSCIGSACEDTCCKGNWNVSVDKEQYEYYKQLDAKNQSRFFQSGIKKNAQPSSEKNYATIPLHAQSGCSFLTTESLCSIHQQYGPELLSHTCRNYPRQTEKINEQFYQTGHLSCPEIARLSLLSNKTIHWKMSTNQIHNGPLFRESQSNEKYYKRVHDILTTLIQQRSFSLQERLWLIGAFLIELSNMSDIYGKSKAISLAFKRTQKAQKHASNHIQDAPNSFLMQMIIQTIYKMKQDSRCSVRFKECLDWCIQGFELYENVQVHDNIIRTYQKKYETYYQLFFKNYAHILENYCLYSFQRQLFPYELKDVPSQYILYLVEFALLKYILIGISASPSGLTENTAIQVFQSYSKIFHHNESCYDDYIGTMYEQFYSMYPERFTECTSILLSE